MNNSPRKDIPPARRQSTEISLAEIENIGVKAKPKKRKTGRALSLLAIAALGGIGVWQWDTLGPHVMPPLKSAQAKMSDGKEAVMQATSGLRESSRADTATRTTPATSSESAQSPQPGDRPAEKDDSNVLLIGPSEDNPAASTTAASTTEDRPQTLLNHRRYDEVKPDQLVPLTPTSEIRLQPAAQAKLKAMLAKAKADGVKLGIVSGFRTIEDQNYLYFDVTAERGESVKTRAEVSAPPGYSEHHTGYAVDFIDEGKPETHVEESFETTAAYTWLKKNAAFYNFEMSFPKDASSSVGYEPWHWRYVGNQESLELFYK